MSRDRTRQTDTEGPWAQTLHRGLELLDVLAHEPNGLTVTELSLRLGVHRAIVYRLVGTLVAHRYVLRGPDGRHRLWVGVFELSRCVAPQWETVATPVLAALAEETQATAHLSIAEDDVAVALFVVEPRHAPMHVAYRPGSQYPLNVAASGRAILAGRPCRPSEPPAVAEARERGYAFSRGEIQSGVAGLAAPIVVAGQAEGSVGIVGLADFDSTHAERVIRAARTIAERIADSDRDVRVDRESPRS